MASVQPSKEGRVPEEELRTDDSSRKELLNRIGPGSYSLSRLQNRIAAEEQAKRKNAEERLKRDEEPRQRRHRYEDVEYDRRRGSRRSKSRDRTPERRSRGDSRDPPRHDRDKTPPYDSPRRHDLPPHMMPSSSRGSHRHDLYRPDSYPSSPRDGRSRRSSPSYRPYQPRREEYDVPAPVVNPPIRLGFDDTPPLGMPPWKPNGQRQDRPGREPPANLEARRAQREAAVVNIWPDSPPKPFKELVPDEKDKSRSRKSRKRRSKRYSSSSDDSEDEYERRRREKRRREKRDRSKRSRSRAESDRERDRSRSRHAESETDSRRSKSRASSQVMETWIERDKTPEIVEDDEGPDIGPQAPTEIKDKLDREAFRNLLPGEGEGMASYVRSGERIPRRGEIGLDASRIQQFEEAGYVMSGSRHQRMNAVRQRKEGQVINAEEKRAMLKAQKEQQQQKEGAIISQFKEMMDERLKVEERREREEREKERERRKER